jgi:hypothetical protein
MNAILLSLDGQEVIIPNAIKEELLLIHNLISKKADTNEKKLQLVEKLIALQLPDWKIQQGLAVLKSLYAVENTPAL